MKEDHLERLSGGEGPPLSAYYNPAKLLAMLLAWFQAKKPRNQDPALSCQGKPNLCLA
jgi:hypothetical protein